MPPADMPQTRSSFSSRRDPFARSTTVVVFCAHWRAQAPLCASSWHPSSFGCSVLLTRSSSSIRKGGCHRNNPMWSNDGPCTASPRVGRRPPVATHPMTRLHQPGRQGRRPVVHPALAAIPASAGETMSRRDGTTHGRIPAVPSCCPAGVATVVQPTSDQPACQPDDRASHRNATASLP